MSITYYDILGVRPDADEVEIKRAYRRLASKYHPDKYSDESLQSDATAAMAVINNVNAVLSDPESRTLYDEFLLQRVTVPAFGDSASSNSTKKSDQGASTNNASSTPSSATPNAPSGTERDAKNVHWPVYAFLGCVAVVTVSIAVALQWADDRRRSLQQTYPLPSTSSSFEGSSFEIRGSPPFGSWWPTHASYFDEAPRMRESGGSSVLVSNAGSDDLYVKLYWNYHPEGSIAVRHLFLPARKSFLIEGVSAGRYELRVRNLKTGRAFRSAVLGMADKDGGSLHVYTLNLWGDNVASGMSEIDVKQF